MNKHITALLFALAALLTACGDTTPTEITPSQASATETTSTSETPSGMTVSEGKLVGTDQHRPGPGEVLLWVSNQSQERDPVTITIEIDGQVAIDDTFETVGGHNNIGFLIRGLEPGTHALSALTDTELAVTQSFTTSADAPRWLTLDHFYTSEFPDDTVLLFNQSDTAVGFD